MGKTRIAAIGQEGKPKREHKKSLKEKLGVRVPGLKGGERVVAVVAEPLEVREPSVAEAMEGKKKAPKPAKVRGRRYLAAKARIESGKLYSTSEAIKLARETSVSRFGGSLELHLVLTRTGEFEVDGKKIKSEPKAPLLHTVVGKLKEPQNQLEANLAKIFKAVGPSFIKKAVISASMGPGVKVDISKISS